MYLLYNRYLRLTSNIEEDEGVRVSGAFIFSVVVFFINSTLFNSIFQKFAEQKTIFQDVGLLFRVMGANFLISMLASFLWATLGNKFIEMFSNFFYKQKNRSDVSENESIWNELFETNDWIDNRGDRIVCIEKDGMVSYGRLLMQTTQISNRTEFVLENSSEWEAYFRRDEKLDDKDKIFPVKSYVYFNIELGLKITFYDTTKYRKWEKENS